MFEFEITDLWGAGRPTRDYTVQLQRRRESRMDRWNLVTPQGRIVAWIVRNEDGKTWDARVTGAAFRGTGPDDPGHVLDEVPRELTREFEPARHSAMAVGARTLEDAASAVAWYLVKHRSPAIGFGAHSSVRTWKSKYPALAAFEAGL